MNLREWVTWGKKMLDCLGSLDDDMKKAYSFLLQYRDLIDELGVCVESVTYLETLCKREGFWTPEPTPFVSIISSESNRQRHQAGGLVVGLQNAGLFQTTGCCA